MVRYADGTRRARRKVGRGRVSSPRGRLNDLAVRPAFVPLLHRAWVRSLNPRNPVQRPPATTRPSVPAEISGRRHRHAARPPERQGPGRCGCRAGCVRFRGDRPGQRLSRGIARFADTLARSPSTRPSGIRLTELTPDRRPSSIASHRRWIGRPISTCARRSSANGRLEFSSRWSSPSCLGLRRPGGNVSANRMNDPDQAAGAPAGKPAKWWAGSSSSAWLAPQSRSAWHSPCGLVLRPSKRFPPTLPHGAPRRGGRAPHSSDPPSA
jgi:hypothetical protein